MVSVSRSGRRNMSLSKTRAKPSTDEPSNHSPPRTACGSRCAGIVMLFTVPSTSTKRKSRNRIPRSDSRSSARSTVAPATRPAAASVFAVGYSLVLGRGRTIGRVPGGAGTCVVGRSPGFIALYRIVHRLLLFELSRSRELLEVKRRLPGRVAAATTTNGARRTSRRTNLDVVVEVELPGVRPKRHLVVLPDALVIDPGFDQVAGEDAAAGEVLVVNLERVEHFEQRARCALDLPLQLRFELVEVLVDRLGWLDLVDDAVQAGHQAGGE